MVQGCPDTYPMQGHPSDLQGYQLRRSLPTPDYSCSLLAEPESCQKYVIDWYVWYMLEILMRYVWDISVICVRGAGYLPQFSLKSTWDIIDICLEMPEIYEIYVYDMCEICMRYMWHISEIHLRHARNMSLICMISTWDI